ncbi:MAG: hypothetical protein ABIE68_04985 [bacterium]
MSQNNQNKTNNNKNMMVKQTQTEQTTAQTKTKKRLKLMVWSVFIISALAVAGAAVLPIIPPEDIRESNFDASGLSGEPTVYVPGKYIKHNTPYDMTTFNIEGDYEQLPRFNNAIAAKNGIIKVTSEVIDTDSLGDEDSAATGLSKVAFTTLLSPLNFSQFSKFIGSNNEFDFFLRGSEEQFAADVDDSTLSWYSIPITTNGFHVISVPSTVTYDWQYFQFGFRLKRDSYYRPKVGNVVYQVLEQRCTTTETECSDGIDNDCDNYIDDEDFDCEEAECGNGECEEGENYVTCPEDCEQQGDANLLYSYGFENFSGEVDSRPEGFPLSSGEPEYCSMQDHATEIVENYSNWAPHSGNYFLLQNDSRGSDSSTTCDQGNYIPLNPEVDGIDCGLVNVRGNIGYNGSACSTNGLDIDEDINTEKLFVRFWSRNSGFVWPNPPYYPKNKWIRVYGYPYESELDSHIIFLTTVNDIFDGDDTDVRLQYGTNTGLDTFPVEDVNDGNWHKWSFFFDFDAAIARIWVDEDNETADNATGEWIDDSGQFGNIEKAGHFIIQANFSNGTPPAGIYHGIDDLEVWDDMPSAN